MGYLQVSCLLLVLATTLVASATVYPVVGLDEMDPIDSCLFICNICFDKKPKTMMACVRDVCLSGKINTGLSYLWVGRECENYPKITAYLYKALNRT